jgi:succinylglutamate desuccinylase
VKQDFWFLLSNAKSEQWIGRQRKMVYFVVGRNNRMHMRMDVGVLLWWLWLFLFLSHGTSVKVVVDALQSVVVFGGTHGNEYTGVWCIQHLQTQTSKLQSLYPSLSIATELANPLAFSKNQRFVNTDLNREFSIDRLRQTTQPKTYKSQRARQLEQKYCNPTKEYPNVDVMIDLHSTTSNMGITLIVPESDFLMTRAAAYVLGQLQSSSSSSSSSKKCQILLHSYPDRLHRPNLSSLARHGFTVEVGPVPQGVLRHDRVRDTLNCLHYLFEFLDATNDREQNYHHSEICKEELYAFYPNGLVPCYRSAKRKRGTEMSGKIAWPTHPQYDHFPIWMVHQDLQDQDFAVVTVGDPLFVSVSGEIITYDGSHGDQVYLMFINEGGYYYAQSGTGIGVAELTAFELETGKFAANDFEDASSLFGEL